MGWEKGREVKTDFHFSMSHTCLMAIINITINLVSAKVASKVGVSIKKANFRVNIMMG